MTSHWFGGGVHTADHADHAPPYPAQHHARAHTMGARTAALIQAIDPVAT